MVITITKETLALLTSIAKYQSDGICVSFAVFTSLLAGHSGNEYDPYWLVTKK
jgi:hypothetical protein